MQGIKVSFTVASVLLAIPALNVAAATELNQAALHKLAQQLDVKYEVISNFNDTSCKEYRSPCPRSKLVLTSPTEFSATDWTLYFGQNAPVTGDQSALFDVKHVNGDLHTLSPTTEFTGFKAGEAVEIPLEGHFSYISESTVMPNYYLTSPGLEPEIIAATVETFDEETGLYTLPHAGSFTKEEQLKRSENDHSPQATASQLFEWYSAIAGNTSTAAENRIIPTIKNASVTGKRVTLNSGLAFDDATAKDLPFLFELRNIPLATSGLKVKLTSAPSLGAQAYSLAISEKEITLQSSSAAGQFYGLISLAWLYDTATSSLPVGTFEDAPRYDFRGIHIDVARNFHSKAMILRLMKEMAMLKLNKLHLHLADDEGWRLEIPGLPELTDLGAYRCHDLSETTCLLPQLGNGPFKDTSVNGFYSVEDYKEILQLAKRYHIEVIPSLDMPGHSRAAIKSMEARYQRLKAAGEIAKAEQYRLVEPQDTTQYSSIQYYNDNTLNPCIPATYRFVEAVISEVKKMHEDAGLPLKRYHIGADETAGAWSESPACAALMKQENIDSPEKLTSLFISRVATIVDRMGITTGAWSDGLSHVKPDMLPASIQSNIWDLLPAQGHVRAQEMANKGWDTVLSLPDVLYFDFPYQADPVETGFYWGSRSTDTYQLFQFMPDNLPAHAEFWTDVMGNQYQAQDSTPLKEGASFTGIQGQLWSEIVRQDSTAEYLYNPRMLALAERAWHQATWEIPYVAGRNYSAETQYFTDELQRAQNRDWLAFTQTMVNKYLPALNKTDIFYRLPVPGAEIRNGKLHAVAPWEGVTIEYREGEGKWQRYREPVEVRGNIKDDIAVRSTLPGTQRVGRSIQVK
ncbi:family 20 glycosylhydrolase [Alteromonas pelagimontana]|uniref:beta-N-acetylhexosaminidase n=1 Tax=Alteromonas pelagimontana TaxID=1858656 RepID=A0A6M4MD11_9ALTE|nr:family 20 glycosylhydrolase [Alteromonas pelagimontana]QJR80455.1 family 20 glycosylhydrolase [Alteromonas pelagimontana]